MNLRMIWQARRAIGIGWGIGASVALLMAAGGPARASTAYGTMNNFDVVNDTGETCHGFEIELEDCHSVDVTYTYNWNHYGVPEITEDNSVAGHPKCVIRWASGKNADGTWTAHTAIPDGPIAPTNGHQFTNPAVNFGGEHFGVGYRGAPTTVRYHWLVDDGGGNLVLGPAVQVSTPTFAFNAGQVVAAMAPAPPEAPPVKEFGEATWVRAIKTTSHNNSEVKLRDLVSDDPDDPDDRNWRNGEPDEVEVEWQLLQTEFGADDGGGNGEIEGAPEELEDGDEIVTRRWEFYSYTGPLDPETGEALADKVADDDLHGVGTKTADGVVYDLANTVVVGDYLGAQMSAFDPDAEVGLVDHLQDGEVGEPYPERTVVIGGTSPFTATLSGGLPSGMSFDAVTGIVSGTPDEAGEYAVTVEASDAKIEGVTRTYRFAIAAPGEIIAPHGLVDTGVQPAGSGVAGGDGTYEIGSMAVVSATPNPGFQFVGWQENGEWTDGTARYEFEVIVNRSLVAVFAPEAPEVEITSAGDGLIELLWPAEPQGWILEESATLSPGTWHESVLPITSDEKGNHVMIPTEAGDRFFFRLNQR